jgi:hypothetical protein
MLAGKISALKYFPNCFWDSVRGTSTTIISKIVIFWTYEQLSTELLNYRLKKFWTTNYLETDSKLLNYWFTELMNS